MRGQLLQEEDGGNVRVGAAGFMAECSASLVSLDEFNMTPSATYQTSHSG